MDYKNRHTVAMSAEAKEARAKYAREWRKKNPEKQQAIVARYWEKRAARIAAENDAKYGLIEERVARMAEGIG